jgi:REP element-mobilizing transposase RayT
MIIKSMGRRTSTKKGQHLFKTLYDYLLHEHDTPEAKTRAKIDIQHNVQSGLSHDEILEMFIENARYLHDRKGANLGYHEIISLPANDLDRQKVIAALREIGQMYLDERAPENIAIGMIHTDKAHVHLHIMLSSNRLYDRRRLRLSKEEFLKVQESVAERAKSRFPELDIDNLYTKDHIRENKSERVRTSRGEQEQQQRESKDQSSQQKSNKKIDLAAQLHGLFEQHHDRQSLESALNELGYQLYQRGRNMGVVDREGKKHRFGTLGLSPHYEAWQERQNTRPEAIQEQPPKPDEKLPEPKKEESPALDHELDRRMEQLKQAREQGKERENLAER